MLRKFLSVLLMTLIALQSVSAMAQEGSELWAGDPHHHLDGSVVQQELGAMDNAAVNCDHCCYHCHCMAHFFLHSELSSLSGPAFSVALPAYYNQNHISVFSAPAIRPPIA